MKKKWSVSKRKRRNRAKKKYINAPIKQNKGIFQFPFACEDKNSNLIFWFMNFCKGKFSKVVHISKEDLNTLVNYTRATIFKLALINHLNRDIISYFNKIYKV